MLKQINIGGENRPIHFGYSAKKRLDPIIRQKANDLKKLLPSDEYDELVGTPTALGLYLFQDLDMQITVLKIGLEEGRRVADQKLYVEHEIPDATICDWLDEAPNAIEEALTIYGDQQMIIMAKKAGEDPEKFKARMMPSNPLEGSSPTSQSGTPSSASLSGGLE